MTPKTKKQFPGGAAAHGSKEVTNRYPDSEGQTGDAAGKKSQARPLTLKDWILISFAVAGIALVGGFVGLQGVDAPPDSVPRWFTVWQEYERETKPYRLAVEWSLAYLIVVGGLYFLVSVLGAGRLRRTLRSFWYGDPEAKT